ncbi:hypothetical protein G3I40_45750 [Streptomyces sp. SID14478]|uniref:hypothetical protein n=1 Tax=Streptomyces sp. SID14478 TaxID=2706073 RepID=UPI0013E030D8|nr:hypothetical protein [Streptomyces sp. SID14478]NEB82466.1 hypothetical protein [Streptomyces sp. SID14478]
MSSKGFDATAPTPVLAATGDRPMPAALQHAPTTGIPGPPLAERRTGRLPLTERPQEWGKLLTEFLRTTGA